MLENNNYQEILKKSAFAITLISGEGCANCVSMFPVVMKQKEKGIDVYIVEASERTSELHEHYGVSLVPTILFTSYGELISKITGYQPEEIFDLYVEAKLEEVCKKK